MQVHDSLKIRKLREMRKKGYSILYLMKLFSIPKTTVWYHIRRVKLTDAQKAVLRAQQGGGVKQREQRWLQAREQAKVFLSGENRELSIILAMLYWAEGHKKFSCSFTNSDGRMIAIYLFILRRVFLIQEDSLLPVIRVFSGMDKNKCLRYWSGVTKIAKERIVIRFNDGGTRGRTPYGICRIVLRKGNQTLKLVHSLIDQVFAETVR